MLTFRTLFFLLTLSPLLAAEEKLSFNRDIRPILSDKCFACHGPDEKHREADLRLDKREAAVADRNGVIVISPGNPDASELIARITATDESIRMPPAETAKQLTEGEKALLK